MTDFTFFDTFAGIGATRLAFESIGGTCVASSEWDKFARQTYEANFHDDSDKHTFFGDITKVDTAEVPDFDVLLGGFPCQPFSSGGLATKAFLGRESGFRDEHQGNLFFDVARIIRDKKPKAFFLENVTNLTLHDKGRTFATVSEVLDGLGYHWTHGIVDARAWVPQMRRRLFIVGFDRPTGFSFDSLDVPLDGPKLGSILDAEVPDKYTLSDKLWSWLQAHAAKHRGRGNGYGYGLVGPEDVARTISARYGKDGSEILVRQEGRNPRKLTPRECARLQGFPESFVIPVSDTQAYHQFGNSMAVPAVRATAEAMKEYL